MDLAGLAADAPERLALIAGAIAMLDARTVLELGVWKGETAAALLRDCPRIETYWMIDPWRVLPQWNKPCNSTDRQLDAARQAAMAATAFAADRRRVLRGTTGEVIGEIADASLDLAYIDGDHTLRGITIDLISTWPKLRPGGLLMGDDFYGSIWQHGRDYEPTLVFPQALYFAEAVDAPIHALGHGQFAIEKPLAGSGGHAFHVHAGEYRRRDLRDHLQLPD